MDPVVLCQFRLILLVIDSDFPCWYVYASRFQAVLFVFFGLMSSPFELQFVVLPLFDCCGDSFLLTAPLAVQLSYFIEVGS